MNQVKLSGNGGNEGSNTPVLSGDGAYVLSHDMLDQIWAQRAAQFAQVPVDEQSGEQISLLVARLGGELYGIETQYVFRIRSAMHIAYVPRVPEWIAGVTNERGRILSVFNLQTFLGLHKSLGGDEEHSTSSLILIETPEMELALLADEVLNVITLPVTYIQEATDAVRGIPQSYIRGVVNQEGTDADQWTRTLDDKNITTLLVLDLRALLSDDRLRVHEEVV